jgi:xanthine dehydrogenase accessory factor
MQEVLNQLLSSLAAGRPVAYTALVETRGSTPQKAGAGMLVFADGSQVGTLGGGCVEAEVKRRALELLPEGRRQILTFQLDHDYGWDDGLICGGRMKMLVDPLRPGDDVSYFEQFARLLNAGAGCTAAVALNHVGESVPDSRTSADRRAPVAENPTLHPGDQYLFDGESNLLACRGAADHASSVVEHLRPLADRPRPYVAGHVSFLPHLPRCRLVIVGGGHVGWKVAELAADVDFDVTVVDDREEFCNADRFPQAKQLICGPMEDVLPKLDVDPSTFCIIVTRGHNHDETALYHLAETPARYIGMIGSKRKIRLIFDDLREAGISEAALARVHAPLGFDIGSQTVPEIAVSIVAELIAHRNLAEFNRRRIVREPEAVGVS